MKTKKSTVVLNVSHIVYKQELYDINNRNMEQDVHMYTLNGTKWEVERHKPKLRNR